MATCDKRKRKRKDYCIEIMYGQYVINDDMWPGKGHTYMTSIIIRNHEWIPGMNKGKAMSMIICGHKWPPELLI